MPRENCSITGYCIRLIRKNEQLRQIEAYWEAFKPTLAYCEGAIWPLEETRDAAVEKYGEQGLLRFLAHRDGVRFECLDPSRAEQALFLKQYFQAIEIKIYFVLIQAIIEQRRGAKTSSAAYTEGILHTLSGLPLFRDHLTTQVEFERALNKFFPEIKDWKKIPCSYFYRIEKGQFLAAIHAKRTVYRDEYMCGQLLKSLKKGERVFALVGRNHVINQNLTLRLAAQD